MCVFPADARPFPVGLSDFDLNELPDDRDSLEEFFTSLVLSGRMDCATAERLTDEVFAARNQQLL